MSEQYPDHPYADALEEVQYHFQCYVTTKDELNKAYHLIELSNRMGDLSTYHPGYDLDTGTLPWEREDDTY